MKTKTKKLSIYEKQIEAKVQKLLKEFKDEHKLTLALDFRKHVYCTNDYNLTPTFSYDFAAKVIILIHDFLYKKFGEQRVIYNLNNLMMDCDRLKISRLKDYLEDTIYHYVVHDFHK